MTEEPSSVDEKELKRRLDEDWDKVAKKLLKKKGGKVKAAKLFQLVAKKIAKKSSKGKSKTKAKALPEKVAAKLEERLRKKLLKSSRYGVEGEDVLLKKVF